MFIATKTLTQEDIEKFYIPIWMEQDASLEREYKRNSAAANAELLRVMKENNKTAAEQGNEGTNGH